MSLRPLRAAQSYQSTRISSETTVLLGHKDAGQTSWPRCLFLEGKNHNGNWTWVKHKMIFSPKMYNMQLEMKCLYVFLVHWEDVERALEESEIFLYYSFFPSY